MLSKSQHQRRMDKDLHYFALFLSPTFQEPFLTNYFLITLFFYLEAVFEAFRSLSLSVFALFDILTFNWIHKRQNNLVSLDCLSLSLSLSFSLSLSCILTPRQNLSFPILVQSGNCKETRVSPPSLSLIHTLSLSLSLSLYYDAHSIKAFLGVSLLLSQ